MSADLISKACMSRRAVRVAVLGAALVLAACKQAPSVDARDVRLITTIPTEEPPIYGLAPTSGVLSIGGGCVRLLGGAQETTLVFPPGYVALAEGRRIVIADEAGHALYGVGHAITVGGAPLSDEPASRLINEEDRGRCLGPYFMVRPQS